MPIDSSRRTLLKAAMAAGALPLTVRAQSFPTRPIKLICPFPPGPTTDAIMRAMAAAA